MNTDKIRDAVELLESVDPLNASRVAERIDEVAAIIRAELDKAQKVSCGWDKCPHGSECIHAIIPAAGLTVEEVMKVCWEWAIDAQMVNHTTDPYYLNGDLRSRLTAAMEAKTRKQ